MMHHHISHHSSPERISTNSNSSGIRRRRRRLWNHNGSYYTIMPRTILAALLIVINRSSEQQCVTSLMVPTSLSSRYQSSCCWVQYRKRRRLNEFFSRYDYDNDMQMISSNMPKNRRMLYNGVILGAEDVVSTMSTSRISTSLFMAAQSSSSSSSEDESNPSDDGDDNSKKKKKKKKNDSSSSNNNKSKRVNKGKDKIENPTAKKGSTTRNKQKQRNTRRKQRNDNIIKSNKQQTKKNKQQKVVNKGTSTKKKGTIQSSSKNTSLKKFKEEPKKRSIAEVDDQDNDIITIDNPNNNDNVQKRIIQLETLVSTQMSEIQKLQRQVDQLTQITNVFHNVVNTLREAGLRIDEDDNIDIGSASSSEEENGSSNGEDDQRTSQQQKEQEPNQLFKKSTSKATTTTTDDIEIFGIAPKSVTDAADAAGSSILSAILAGKHRMLVDVRDAELTRDPKLFVEFIELAILPVAAGLEGVSDNSCDESSYISNRVKIVFPTVKELLSYRKQMALSAPDVVSLSTLGLDPIDAERDNLIVVIAPSPDDIAGVTAMEQLIALTTKGELTQPVVVMNHHMIPVDMSQFGKFTVVYHLRLLSVQYMTGEAAPEYVSKLEEEEDEEEDDEERSTAATGDDNDDDTSKDDGISLEDKKRMPSEEEGEEKGIINKSSNRKDEEEEQALEAAMTHAHEIGVHQGVTRAMVIRAYPK